MKKNLPTPIELMIYEFLTSEEFLFIIPHICRHSLELTRTADANRKMLANEFSQYFRPNEIQSYHSRDITRILLIMIMHRRFTSGIHLHNTPYYLNLIEQTLEVFLSTRKTQSIKDFPWAAVIMGNIMRVKEKKEAAKYFEMGIQAEPPLPIAETLLALTYSISELKELQKFHLISDKENSLSPAMIFDDFIVSYLKGVGKYIQQRSSIFSLYPPKSKARFQFLERNFFYADIIL